MEVIENRHRTLVSTALVLGIFTVLALFGAGCVTQEVTSPPRSATEQLLLSTAADQAMTNADFSIFAGKKVYLDFTYFDSYDSKYAEGEIRDALSRAGALLTPDDKTADIIMEARSGAYSAETNSVFFGIPSIPLPVPSTSEIPILPQLALYQKSAELSYAKFALLAYSAKSRAHIYSSGPLDGTTFNTYHSLLVFSWWSSDIPEKQKTEKKKQKYESWFPQYDLQNMPGTSSPSPAPANGSSSTAPANSSK